MRHPTDGTLRRLLDEPAGVADADREHIGDCPQCLSELAAARRDAAVATASLDFESAVDGMVDVDAGWYRLSRAVAGDGSARSDTSTAAALRARGRGRRTALRSPVVAAVGVLVLLAGAGAAAAADWLPIFRTEQIATVTASEADLVRLPDLSAFGDVEVTEEPNLRTVPGAADAAAATGLAVPQVGELPSGVTGDPTFQVGDRMSALFTFSAAKAEQAAGGPLPAPPPGLDGSRFRLVAGPGLAEVWSRPEGPPSLVVARAVAPTGYSSGVPFATARDYLLSLPGLPTDVAAQLRSFSDDGTTLPLFVDAERMTSAPADVGGLPATVLSTRDGAMSGVVWVDRGVVTAVAGTLTADEVLAVARGLR